ncbi:MAG: DUF1588 domain-containing protein [Opitutales bacterium]|nr:DUF1588 domain-containing protein [Opitutales bacterium]
MKTKSLINLLIGISAAVSLSANESTPISDTHYEMLSNYCLNCHDEVEMKGDLNLDHYSVDWNDKDQRHIWENAFNMLRDGLMPPEEEDQPTKEERIQLLTWLDEKLLHNTPIGGTLPRRLSAEEYRATIRDLFELPEYELPLGFPKDSEYHGFNNVGEGLVLSPPLMEAYAKVAGQIADTIYPPARKAPPSTTRTAGPNDMVLSFSAGKVVDDALLLVSRGHEIFRSCSWPSRMEIMSSGTYRVTVSAAKHKPTWGGPMKLEIRARELSASDRSRADIFRLLKVMDVPSTEPTTITFEAELYEGQTLLFRWMNADMAHDYTKFAKHMREWFEKDKRWLAAWQHTVFPNGDFSKIRTSVIRGRSGWEFLNEALNDPNLDMSRATMDDELTVKFLELADSNTGMFNFADILCHYYFTNGPALEFHQATIEGPLKMVDGPREMLATKLQKQFIGTRKSGQSDEALTREILTGFLPKAFRRPVDQQSIDTYLGIAKRHWAAGNSFDDTMHLLIRNILISPRFLYRLASPDELDDYDLASRLSYFLTQAPPDQQLLELAQAGKLSNPKTLRAEAIRLMPREPGNAMVQSFTGQWLDTKLLPEIMPDPKFNFSEAEIAIAEEEVEHFFTEILTNNLPMTDFIDPDFHYTTPTFAKDNYQYTLTGTASEDSSSMMASESGLQKLPLERGGRFGGLLAQSAIMTATANGVDTQAVLRGVWVLENIMGTPPPEPPKSVPGLTPDTRGATTPREMLAAHMGDASCASCHRLIDPIGFMLENYDPVGNWRELWPKIDVPIDSSGVLPDGTHINDISDFKVWLVDNIDLFSQCLSEKLLTYATGRVPNYAERHEIEKIVKANQANGNGFQDLFLALVTSETFRTK